MLEAIRSRRSIRQFTDQPVSEGEIESLLSAAMAAPSANARYPWEFVVVRDPELRRQLAGVHQFSGMCAQAPVVFVPCGDESRSDYWIEDCSAATENLLLQARALGLGGVWVGIRPRPERERKVKEILSIPDPLRVLCLVPVGHPAEERPPHGGFDRDKVHWDRY